MDQPPKPTKDDLMAKVTGQKKPGQPPKMLQTPPPAHMPGVKGNPPLPQGKVVAQRRPSSLTSEERAKLESIGWDDSMPIPKNMSELLEQVQAEKLAEVSSAELPLPVDPRTPKIKPPEDIPIEKLDAAKKEKLRKLLTGAVEAEEEDAREAANQARIGTMPQGVQMAYQMASSGAGKPIGDLGELEVDVDAETGKKPPTAKKQEPKFQVIEEDDGEEDFIAPPAPPDAPHAKPAPAADVKATTDTGAGGTGTGHCPHCMWDLRMPDVPEPPYHKKMSFLHSVLGQKCYTDEVELFGGSVIANFRALTVSEIEVVYKQAYRDRETGRAPTEMDFWERVNRYRLFLQLNSLRTTTADKGFVHDLPDGLSQEANPMATSFWAGKVAEPAPNETVMPEIEKFVVSNVLKTEAIFRVVNSACNQFNRVIAKMEAMVDNSDFWSRTEEQS